VSITLKSDREIDIMRKAGEIVANTLVTVRDAVEPGMTLKEIDHMVEQELRAQHAEAAFPHVNNFPGSACVSVNQEVVHGIPSKRRLREGDVVKIDVGAIYDGYHGDACISIPVGDITTEARELIDVTEESLALGIAAIAAGGHLNDAGTAIEECVRCHKFSVVRQLVGHGIGRKLHEDPNVPHYRLQTRGLRLRPGMTFTIEPMINMGTDETVLLDDGWTVVTKDGKLSAQFEHTIAITKHGPEILTRPSHGESWALPSDYQLEVQ
jgi:methionyl aminopeptidase